MNEDPKEKGRGLPAFEDVWQKSQRWKTDKHGKQVLTGSLYNRYFLRKISIYVTWLFIVMGVKANTATVMMTIAGLAGIVACIPHALMMTIAGAVLLFLFDLLDAVDGDIARWHKSSSTKGLYLDLVSHVLIDFASRGIAAFHLFFWTQDHRYMLLGLSAVVSSLMGRAVLETCLRINAETQPTQTAKQSRESALQGRGMRLFVWLCNHLKKPVRMVGLPIGEARIVHLITLLAIFLSYGGSDTLLQGIAWFYAIYCPIRLLFDIAYLFAFQLVDTSHTREDIEYRWPI